MTLYQKITEIGLDAVSDRELFSLVLGGCADSIPELQEVRKMDFYDLKSIGLTTQQACKVLALMEIGRRKDVIESQVTQIKSSMDAAKLMTPILSDLNHEEFWAIYLRRNNSVITTKQISKGGTAGTVVDTKVIAKHGINLLASGVILAHNHPSGNKKPSEADKSITKKIVDGFNLLDISVLDHIIIAGSGYYSFADDGIL